MKKNVAKLGLMLTLSGLALTACSTNDGGNGSDAGSVRATIRPSRPLPPPRRSAITLPRLPRVA